MRFFLVILKLCLEKLVQYMLFTVLPISSYYLWPPFSQHTDTALEKFLIFWGDARIDPIFGFFIKSEVLLSQAMSYLPEHSSYILNISSKFVVLFRTNTFCKINARNVRENGRTIELTLSKLIKLYNSLLDKFADKF